MFVHPVVRRRSPALLAVLAAACSACVAEGGSLDDLSTHRSAVTLGQFDWGDPCEPVTRTLDTDVIAGVINLGDIPAGRRDARLALESPAATWLRVFDRATDTRIVGPGGLLPYPNGSCAVYEGVEYCFDATDLGDGRVARQLEVRGETNRQLGIHVGSPVARPVTFRYGADSSPNCRERGTGLFQRWLYPGYPYGVAVIPAGAIDPVIELRTNGGVDADLMLLEGPLPIISRAGGLLSGAGPGEIELDGLRIEYSGNAGTDAPGNETITMHGVVATALELQVVGFGRNLATVTYDWGLSAGSECDPAASTSCGAGLTCKPTDGTGVAGTCHVSDWCEPAMVALHCPSLPLGVWPTCVAHQCSAPIETGVERVDVPGGEGLSTGILRISGRGFGDAPGIVRFGGSIFRPTNHPTTGAVQWTDSWIQVDLGPYYSSAPFSIETAAGKLIAGTRVLRTAAPGSGYDHYRDTLTAYASVFGFSEQWLDWMFDTAPDPEDGGGRSHRTRYLRAAHTAVVQSKRLRIAYRFDDARGPYPGVAALPGATVADKHAEHMRRLTAYLEASFPTYDVEVSFGGDPAYADVEVVANSTANVTTGSQDALGRTWPKILVSNDGIVVHELGHFLGLNHHYANNNASDAGEGKVLPPEGEPSCIMDKTRGWCSACAAAMGLPAYAYDEATAMALRRALPDQ